MIFDHRHLDEIKEEEIENIVNEHYGERQHLELKAKLPKDAGNQPLETLRDIVSLANGGGGYLIIGIKDDGTGRAESFSDDLGDEPENIKRKIGSWCQDHVADRIIDLEIGTLTVKGHALVVVRVPDSERVPHMLKINDKTDFWRRYHDGKRSMTMGEIRDAFAKDLVGRRLSAIEGALKRMTEIQPSQSKPIQSLDQIESGHHPAAASNEAAEIFARMTDTQQDESKRIESLERLKSGTYPVFLPIADGKTLADVCRERFLQEKRNEKYFRIAATPMNPKASLINVDDPDIRALINNPPGSRYGGWHMNTDTMQLSRIQRFAEGVFRGRKDSEYLEVISNGHMEFWAPLDRTFCWQQSEEEFRIRPRLYPYAVTEYPVSFARLYRALIDYVGIEDEFLLEIQYRNLKGYSLPAYAPNQLRFIRRGFDASLFPGEHYERSTKIPNDFDPDQSVYSLIKDFYVTFGHEEWTIPFFDKETRKFVFE